MHLTLVIFCTCYLVGLLACGFLNGFAMVHGWEEYRDHVNDALGLPQEASRATRQAVAIVSVPHALLYGVLLWPIGLFTYYRLKYPPKCPDCGGDLSKHKDGVPHPEAWRNAFPEEAEAQIGSIPLYVGDASPPSPIDAELPAIFSGDWSMEERMVLVLVLLSQVQTDLLSKRYGKDGRPNCQSVLDIIGADKNELNRLTNLQLFEEQVDIFGRQRLIDLLVYYRKVWQTVN
jgi:hypothetical protein